MCTRIINTIFSLLLSSLISTQAQAEFVPQGCPSLKNLEPQYLSETHKIANSLCTAAMASPEDYSSAVDALWSEDGVQMNHEPPLPGDGLKTQKANRDASIARDQLSYQLMPDYRLEEVDGKVVGTSFWIFYKRVGTLKNGKVMASPIAGRFHTKDGKITDVRLTIDLSTLSDFIAAQRKLAR